MDKKQKFTYSSRYKNPISKSVIQRKKPLIKNNSITSNKSQIDLKNNIQNDVDTLHLSRNKANPKKNQKSKKLQLDSITYYEDNSYFNLLKKEKEKLAKYINNNENDDIKLIGNERYKQVPLSKILNNGQDNIFDEKMGLIPLPLRSMKRKSKVQELYKIQRSLVRMRRLQYDKMRRRKDNYDEFIENIINIQRWWKHIIIMRKIRKIQIYYKLFKHRKKIKRNKKYIQIFFNLIYSKIFNILKYIKYIKKPILSIDSYISKSLPLISINTEKKINKLQKNIKIYLLEKDNRKIYKLNKEKEGYYIDKIQLPIIALKMMEFINKIRHVMQLISFKKKIKKGYNTNDINNIIKVQKTYKLHYKNIHNNNNKIMLIINSNKNKYAEYISIKRIKKNNKAILLIQENTKLFLDKIHNIIRNKPRSFDYKQINHQKLKNKNNQRNFNINLIEKVYNNSNKLNKKEFRSKIFEFKTSVNKNIILKKNNKNQIFYNNNNNKNYIFISYISKDYKINLINKIIQIQTNIRKYVYQKKAKKEYYNKNTKYIEKNIINKYFLITKEKFKRKEILEKIKLLQKIYKKRYKYLKNNTLVLQHDKRKKIEKNKNIVKTKKLYYSYSPNNFKNIKEREKILMSFLIKRNKKSLIIQNGFYYEKIRININTYEKILYQNKKIYILLNKSNRGIYISKARIINNNKKIEFIQKDIKQRLLLRKNKENTPIIKKPEIKKYEIKNDKIKKRIKSNKIQVKKDNNNINIIAEKIYTLYSKNNLSNFPHINMNNYYYISKIKRYNHKYEYELNSEREYESIKNHIIGRKYENIDTSSYLISDIESEIIPKKSNNKIISIKPLNLNINKSIQNTEQLNITEDEKDINIEFEKDILTFRRLNNKEDKPFIKKNIDLCYIEKKRFFNKHEKKKINESNREIIYKKNLNRFVYISKERIKYINKIYDNEKKEFNDSLNNYEINFYNKDKYTHQKRTSRNNFSQIKTEYSRINEKDSLKNTKNTEVISNGNSIIHLDKSNSIDIPRKTRRNINIYSKINYFKNKKYYIYFFQLLNIFISKNIQEYIFYKLISKINNKININSFEIIGKYNKITNFNYPFYIRILHKLFLLFKKDDLNNTKIKNFFIQIFPFFVENKSFFYNLVSISSQNKKKLINTNILSFFDKNEIIDFFGTFFKFDKNLNNKNSIINIIKGYTNENKNIFAIIRFIDKEIEESEINNYNSNKSNDELLDLDFN